MGRRGKSGHSLVEVLVATLCLGLLLAGMTALFSACLRGWRRVNQDLAAQRSLRLGLGRVAEDLRQLGCRFQPPGPAPGPSGSGPDPAAGWPGGLDLEAGADGAPDACSFLLDLPAPAPAALAAVSAGAPWVRSEARLELRTGDLALFLDGPWEWRELREPATLPAGRAAALPVVPLDLAHRAGARVRFIRTRRLVRYAVVPLDLDRSGAVPCLARFEAPCPEDGTLPRWSTLSGKPSGPMGGREVVAERVAGLRIGRGPEPGLLRVSLSSWAPEAGQRARSVTLEVLPRNGGGPPVPPVPPGAGP